MIDHKKKMLFVHIPKNAGTSIERAVFTDCDFKNICNHEYLYGFSPKHGINLQHATIEELLSFKLISKQTLESYQSFAVIRNPFTRSISSYFWLMKDLKIKDSFKNFLLQEGEFSKTSLSKRKIFTQDHMYSQTTFLTYKEEIKVKNLLRFEELPDSFNAYLRILGVKSELKMHYKKNKKNRLKIIKLLNKENLKLIQKRFEEDFLNFDYDIDFRLLKFLISYG